MRVLNDLLLKILLFKSLFKGRDDVFAIRWEKENRSGYMPAYFYDPYLYRIHKMKGGTFQNYPNKTYLPLTDEQIIKHLNGEQHIGIYPLLTDNTSYFLVADFDDKNWLEQSISFINLCQEKIFLLTWNVPVREMEGMFGYSLILLTGFNSLLLSVAACFC